MPPSQPQITAASSDLKQTLIATLSREYSFEILQELYARGWSTASEVARALGVHVATAMRNLGEMEMQGLLAKRTRDGGDLTEYALSSPRIEIVIDLAENARNLSKGVADAARKVLVRDRANRSVVTEADEERRTVRRLSFVKGLRWRTIVRTLELTEDEGRFLFAMPFASERPRSVAAIAKDAGIDGGLRVGKVLEFVNEAERLGVLEVVR